MKRMGGLVGTMRVCQCGLNLNFENWNLIRWGGQSLVLRVGLRK